MPRRQKKTAWTPNIPLQTSLLNTYFKIRNQLYPSFIPFSDMNDEEIYDGICFGLSWLWMVCEDGRFGKYNTEWFFTNLTRFSVTEDISVENWNDSNKANFHEFFELIFILQSYNLLVNTNNPQSVNYKYIFSAMNKLHFQHLKTYPYRLTNKNLNELKKILLSLQQQAHEKNIYAIISTESHATSLKINPQEFRFYDSNGFLLINIDDIVNYLSSKEFSSCFDNPDFKFFHISFYTVTNQKKLQKAKGTASTFDKENNLEESTYSHPKIYAAKTINFRHIPEKNRKSYLSALILERQNKIVTKFLNYYPSLVEDAIIFTINHKNNGLLKSLLINNKHLLNDIEYQNKIISKIIKKKNLHALKILTNYNISFDQYLRNQQTALHDVVLHNLPEMAAILLPFISLEDKDEHNNNLLHLSCGNEHVETLSLLLASKKYNHYQVNDRGFTPIELAITNRNFLAFKLFYQHNPNIIRRLYQGKSLLQLAIVYNDHDIIDFLLQCKIAINEKDSLGTTAAHTAITIGDLSALKKLVKHSCNIDAPDKDGKTLLHYAVLQNNTKMVQFLINQGADLFKRDRRDRTAFQIARHKKHYECIHMLHKGREQNIARARHMFFASSEAPKYSNVLIQNDRYRDSTAATNELHAMESHITCQC